MEMERIVWLPESVTARGRETNGYAFFIAASFQGSQLDDL